MPSSSLRPRNSEAQRCGQRWSMTPTRPDAVAKRDQPLAQQHQPHRRAVALQFRRHRRRQPVLPHHFAHDRAGADADQILAVLLLAHVFLAVVAARFIRTPAVSAVTLRIERASGQAAWQKLRGLRCDGRNAILDRRRLLIGLRSEPRSGDADEFGNPRAKALASALRFCARRTHGICAAAANSSRMSAYPTRPRVVFLRSPYAHARIRSITVPPDARKQVFTAADLPRMQPIRIVSHATGAKSPAWPPLATDKVRYVGEAIAACVAPTRAEAEDLAAAVTSRFRAARRGGRRPPRARPRLAIGARSLGRQPLYRAHGRGRRHRRRGARPPTSSSPANIG